MIQLSKRFEDYPDAARGEIWVEPEVYNTVKDKDVWIIYGKKGAGKTALIEYLKNEPSNWKCKILRPTFFLQRLLHSIPLGEINSKETLDTVVFLLNYSFTVNLMTEFINFPSYMIPNSHYDKIHRFLESNGFICTSVMTRITHLVGALTTNFTIISPQTISAIEEMRGGNVDFYEAKDSFYEILKTFDFNILLCIDEIDEMYFTNSAKDISFVNALIVYTAHNNREFTKNQVGFKALMTIPSELLFQKSLYGFDQVRPHCKPVKWDADKIQLMLKKRMEFELKNLNSLSDDSPTQSWSNLEDNWGKFFPLTLTNKMDKIERPFDYFIRHTFYTPRQILELCDVIKDELELWKIPQPHSSYLVPKHSAKVQRVIEEHTQLFVQQDFFDIYQDIYEGLEDIIFQFYGRPNIWTESEVESFLIKKGFSLTLKENKRRFSGNELILELHKVGFLGLAQIKNRQVQGNDVYSVRYSFLEKYPINIKWNLIVVPPIFYDAINIKSIGDVIVCPHESLNINSEARNLIEKYDFEDNEF